MEKLKIKTSANGWIVEMYRTKDWEKNGDMYWHGNVTIAKIIGYSENNTPIILGKNKVIEEYSLGGWTKEKRVVPIIVDTLKEAKEIAAMMIKEFPNEAGTSPDVYLLGYGENLIITKVIEKTVESIS